MGPRVHTRTWSSSLCVCVCVCSFPSCHFGKLYGLIMALSAVVSLLQYPCFALVKNVLGGDPLYVSDPPSPPPRHTGREPAQLAAHAVVVWFLYASSLSAPFVSRSLALRRSSPPPLLSSPAPCR